MSKLTRSYSSKINSILKKIMNEEEKKWEDDFELNVELQKGYMTQKATKPLTLAYSMVDNPVGVAAWIIEKFHGWSDIKNNDFE